MRTTQPHRWLPRLLCVAPIAYLQEGTADGEIKTGLKLGSAGVCKMLTFQGADGEPFNLPLDR